MTPDDTPPPPKHISMADVRLGITYVIEIPPTSPWHELLPQHQACVIRPVKT